MFSSIFFSFGGSHPSRWVFSSDEAPSHHHPAHHEGVVIWWCSSPEDLSMIFKLTTNFGWTDAMWQSYRFFKGKSSWFADLVVRPKVSLFWGPITRRELFVWTLELRRSKALSRGSTWSTNGIFTNREQKIGKIRHRFVIMTGNRLLTAPCNERWVKKVTKTAGSHTLVL